MDMDEIEQWLQFDPRVEPRLASALSVRGLKPDDAALRLWSGVVHPSGLNLAARVTIGNLDPTAAAAELAAWRACGSPRWSTGS